MNGYKKVSQMRTITDKDLFDIYNVKPLPTHLGDREDKLKFERDDTNGQIRANV